MLLWVLILAIFGALVALFGRALPRALRADALAVQGLISLDLPRLHSPDLEPVRAPRPRAVRGARPQSDPPGPGPRHPSAAALSRLCRLLDRLFVRRGGSDRGPHRRGLGAVREAIHPRRLELPHPWHRRWLVLGLLHAGLGRLLVLGSGRERFPHAVARRHRLPPFGRGDGKARRAESLDDLSRHPRLLVLAARHLPRSLGRAHLRPRLRQRSAPRRLHSRHSGAVHIRLVRALRLARADAQAGRPVRAGFPRGGAGRQQSAFDHLMRHGPVRHPLSAGARATDGRQDHRRRTLLQPHLRRAPAYRLLRRAVRLLARLEARRPLGGRAAADLRAHPRRGDRSGRRSVARRRFGASRRSPWALRSSSSSAR